METKNPLPGGQRASNVLGRNNEACSTPDAIDATIVDRHVLITGGLNNLFCVTVQPPLAGHDPMIFDNHKKARGFAGGLRMVHRWQIVDETGGYHV